MSSANVLQPSAPPENIYPKIQPPDPDFRMQKVNEVSVALNKEVDHYRAVAKKYKRTKKVFNWSAAGSSVLSATCSSASFGSALSFVSLLATIPLGIVGGCFALASSRLIIACKKLDSKIKKHQEIVTLAIAKRDTIDWLFSKALTDNQISDGEFQLIMTEFSQYNLLKESVHAKLTRHSSRPDIEKIKKDVRSEMAKNDKTLVGGALVAFTCLAPARSFPPLTRRLSLPFILWDRVLRSRGISEHPQLSAGPGRANPGVIAADSLTPLPLTTSCTCFLRNQGVADSHIQEHHQSIANRLLAHMGYLCFTSRTVSDMWCIFFLLCKTYAYL